MSERVAVIDLGSNSARLIILHIYANGAYNLVYHQKESVRLGEGMGRDQMLQPVAIERALSALRNCGQMCRIMKVDTILAVATAAVRNTRNGPDFLALAEKETGLPIQAISGESEALLGYLGATNTLDVRDGVSAMLALMERGQPGVPVNICNGVAPKTEEVLNLLIEIFPKIFQKQQFRCHLDYNSC